MNCLIRTDTNNKIGFGHVIRMLGLAEYLKDEGFHPIFLFNNSERSIVKSLFKDKDYVYVQKKGMDEVEFLLQNKKKFKTSFLIIDSYEILESTISAIKDDFKIVLFDDFHHLSYYDVDFIVNINYLKENLIYHCRQNTEVLQGCEYFIIRKELVENRDFYLSSCGLPVGFEGQLDPAVKPQDDSLSFFKIIVLLGGSDYLSLNIKVLENLLKVKEKFNNIKVILVTTKMQEKETLKKIEKFEKQEGVEVYYQPNNLAQLMAFSDIAVAGGGLTKYELAFLGVPAICISQIEHQYILLKDYEETGTIINSGFGKNIDWDEFVKAVEYLIKNKDKRYKMSNAGKKLVDGQGAVRIVKEII